MRMNDKEIICFAQLLYGGIKEYHAVVIKSDIFPGSGDYEDPVDVQEDKEITCYQVLFEDLDVRDVVKGLMERPKKHEYEKLT